MNVMYSAKTRTFWVRGLILYSSMMSSGMTYSGMQTYSCRHFFEGGDKIKFGKSMQMKRSLFLIIEMLRRSLDMVI